MSLHTITTTNWESWWKYPAMMRKTTSAKAIWPCQGNCRQNSTSINLGNANF